jgi:hypothetical protein
MYDAMDMAGNVAEWVEDWYNETYDTISLDRNPTGPNSGDRRVVRGGAWNSTVGDIRTASRFSFTPDEKLDTIGFRCATDVTESNLKNIQCNLKSATETYISQLKCIWDMCSPNKPIQKPLPDY